MVKGAVPKPIENIPGPSHLIPDRTPPISPTESELDIERGLDFGPGEKDDNYGLEPPQEEEEEDPYGVNLMKLCREGGIKLYSTHCISDKVLFPKCATPVKKSLTRLLDVPPTHHYHKDTIQVPVELE